jgi:hypothetical protein
MADDDMSTWDDYVPSSGGSGPKAASGAPPDMSTWDDYAPGTTSVLPAGTKSESEAQAGAFGSGVVGAIPFGKDIAAAAVPAIANAGQYLSDKTGGVFPAPPAGAYPTNYTDARAAIDEKSAALKNAHPYTSLAGSVAGVGALGRLMPASSIGQAAGSGAIYGGLQGAGEGTDLPSRARDAAWGFGLGGIGGAAGGLLASPFKAAAPDVMGARDAAGQFGVDLPRGMAGPPIAQSAGHLIGATPFGGALDVAGAKAAGQTGDAIAEQAARLGSGTKQGAVDNAVPAVRDWMDTGFKQQAQKIYSPLSGLNGSPRLGDMPNTRAIAQDIMNQAGGKNAANEITPAVQDVLDAATRPGGLTFAQMNGLKQDLGKSASWDARGDSEGFKRLYGALNDDVRAHAQAIGGNQGLVSFDSANSQFQGLLDQAKGVRKLLGTGSDESVVDRFTTLAQDSVGRQGKGGDLATLAKVKSAVPQPVYDELVSSMVGKLGQTTDGSGTTSMKGFLQDYAKMSPAAKTQIFSTPAGQQVRGNLDQISKVASLLQNAKGGSHIGGQVAGVEQSMSFLENLFNFKLGTAARIAGSAATGKMLGNYLASPTGSGMVARAMRASGLNALQPSAATLTNLRNVAGQIGAVTGANVNQALQNQ